MRHCAERAAWSVPEGCKKSAASATRSPKALALRSAWIPRSCAQLSAPQPSRPAPASMPVCARLPRRGENWDGQRQQPGCEAAHHRRLTPPPGMDIDKAISAADHLRAAAVPAADLSHCTRSPFVQCKPTPSGDAPAPFANPRSRVMSAKCYRDGRQSPRTGASLLKTKHSMPKTRLAHCSYCNDTRHFRKRSLDHLSHLAATVFTFGLWSVAWLSVTIHHLRKPWRCTYCGSRIPQSTSPEPCGPTEDQIVGQAAARR